MKKELEAEVLRLFHAEGWRRSTIAKQLGLHHSAVARVLTRNGVIPSTKRLRRSKVDDYLAFMAQTLEKYPKLTATRLHEMVRRRGYEGGIDHFRDFVSTIRPAPKGEAYQRLATLPGEQAQCDWAHFGKLRVGAAERRLLAFAPRKRPSKFNVNPTAAVIDFIAVFCCQVCDSSSSYAAFTFQSAAVAIKWLRNVARRCALNTAILRAF